MKNFIFLFFVIIALQACKSSKAKTDDLNTKNKNAEKVTITKTNCGNIIPAPENFYENIFNHSNIVSAQIKGSDLFLSYTYSGCEKAEPVLATINQADGKRSVLINLELKIEGAGMCEMLLADSACFDLNSIKALGKQWSLILNEDTTLFYQNQN